MTIDLSKLTPAPWSARSNHDHSTLPPQVDSVKENGIMSPYPVIQMMWLCHESTKEAEDRMIAECEANCEFVALARNAFDVMMRRGWGVFFSASGWGVVFPNESRFSSPVLRGERYTDPLNALVEADKWMTEQVEAKKKEAKA
jgi:hypothetical protein